jgi:hypothetical protein
MEDSAHFPSPQTEELDEIVRQYFRDVPYEYRNLSAYVANFFIRQPEAPLKQYLFRHFRESDMYSSVIAWGKVAPVFDAYGTFLIRRHPLAFARYYLLLNARNYFLPPLEKLEVYNLGTTVVWPVARFWFGFPKPTISSVSPGLQGKILFLYPGLFLMANVFFGIWIVKYFWPGVKPRISSAESRTVVMWSIFIALNFFFSVFANIIVIRYEIFPMIMLLWGGLLIKDLVEREMFLKMTEERLLNR